MAIETTGKRRSKWENRNDITTHFFITTVQTGIDSFEDSPDIWKKKNSSCCGYTDTLEKAEKAVLDNYGDMNETCYQWIIIEEHVMDPFAIGTGLFQWYHWNQDKEGYERCRQPDWAKNIVHWGIG